MKRVFLFLIMAAALVSCKGGDARVMARAVPERADDFVFENNLIAGRFYGEALESQTTSPGIDIWVKQPGKLVANDWYAAATAPDGDKSYYHHDHGGKDCYKVGVSLGGGASVPFVDSVLCYPATNYRSCELLEEGPDKVVFVLHYPEWTAGAIPVALDKKVTVFADSYFCKVEDTYTFKADSLEIAAGVFRHPDAGTVEAEDFGEDYYALWESASDQSAEPEDGMIGVAVVVPGGGNAMLVDGGSHGVCLKKVASGEPLVYWFGSCWNKAGDILAPNVWFELAATF